ncbi:MAG: PEP-CTERM sorting domain-containing protein [Verrucomicrobiota bacterium]|jgi:hypothetical protein
MKSSLNKHWFQAGLACLLATATAGYAQSLVFTFNSASDISGWGDGGQNITVSKSFVSNDTPSGQSLSTGSMMVSGTYDSTHSWGVIQLYFSAPQNLTSYTDFVFDYKVIGGGPDIYNHVDDLQWMIMDNGYGWDQHGDYWVSSTPTGWQHGDFLMSSFPSGHSIDSAKGIILSLWDGYYSSSTSTVQIELCNIGFTGGSVPEPSSLALVGCGALAFGLIARFRKKIS